MGMFQTLGRVMVATSATLKLRCGACGHEAAFSRIDAFRLFGSGAAPYDVRAKARCSMCGKRGHVTAWV